MESTTPATETEPGTVEGRGSSNVGRKAPAHIDYNVLPPNEHHELIKSQADSKSKSDRIDTQNTPTNKKMEQVEGIKAGTIPQSPICTLYSVGNKKQKNSERKQIRTTSLQKNETYPPNSQAEELLHETADKVMGTGKHGNPGKVRKNTADDLMKESASFHGSSDGAEVAHPGKSGIQRQVIKETADDFLKESASLHGSCDDAEAAAPEKNDNSKIAVTGFMTAKKGREAHSKIPFNAGFEGYDVLDVKETSCKCELIVYAKGNPDDKEVMQQEFTKDCECDSCLETDPVDLETTETIDCVGQGAVQINDKDQDVSNGKRFTLTNIDDINSWKVDIRNGDVMEDEVEPLTSSSLARKKKEVLVKMPANADFEGSEIINTFEQGCKCDLTVYLKGKAEDAEKLAEEWTADCDCDHCDDNYAEKIHDDASDQHFSLTPIDDDVKSWKVEIKSNDSTKIKQF